MGDVKDRSRMAGMIDKKRLFSKLPHLLQLPLARAYCNRKKKWVQHLQTPVALIFFVTSRCNPALQSLLLLAGT